MLSESPVFPVCAQTVATSAMEAFVIHIFVPFKTQPSDVFFAVVIIPPGFDPWSGSVSPKHPIFSPVASLGSHSCFCSSVPYV